jgi:hypothetical protein
MRNLLALLGAVVVTFAVVGWFRGWYHVKTSKGADGNPQVNIDINSPKIQEDLSQSRQRLWGTVTPAPQETPHDPQHSGTGFATTPGRPAAAPPRPAGGGWSRDKEVDHWFYPRN